VWGRTQASSPSRCGIAVVALGAAGVITQAEAVEAVEAVGAGAGGSGTVAESIVAQLVAWAAPSNKMRAQDHARQD
jgi:hypothetical protein